MNCDKMITVSDGIAIEYFKNFNIKPGVVTNACFYVDIKTSDIDSEHIKLIHHGGATPSRKIELMIKMMDYLDKRFTLDLMLLNTSPDYLKKLKHIANNKDNIRFIKPIPMRKVVYYINEYDIGIYILEENSFNNKYALPNKLFEFIQAKLAVAIGPSLEMAKIVKKYNCGIVASDFKPETMAKELNKLTKDEINYYKYQSDKASQELSAERNLQKFTHIVASLLA